MSVFDINKLSELVTLSDLPDMGYSSVYTSFGPRGYRKILHRTLRASLTVCSFNGKDIHVFRTLPQRTKHDTLVDVTKFVCINPTKYELEILFDSLDMYINNLMNELK